MLDSHLRGLESESIFIIREAAAELQAPVLLYSAGKDSSVLLHLALKAFAPAPLPFPVMHIDTTWKFREMIAFRDALPSRHDVRVIVHRNEQGVEQRLSPLNGDRAYYTHVMKTQALKQALDLHGFDGAIGGSRRDEDPSRNKERIFSWRDSRHGWDPRRQRPELWRLYNTRLKQKETMRIFPLSNWTERDVWTYIREEAIEVVGLYFAERRPVVARNGQWIVVDDERLPLAHPGEPELRSVRFRTLGCYPLTGAIESNARTIDEILAETEVSRRSERAGRLIDQDEAYAMEKKKREGYF